MTRPSGELPPPLDLGGTWRAVVADEGRRRLFADVDHPEHGWHDLVVPGHWRSTPAFAETDGPVLHRRRFEAGAPSPEHRSWLVFDGLFYQGDVWLDGAYLGATEGYFVRHTFEVTDALAARHEHVVAVEATCAPQDDRTAKRNITGVFQHWDCLDPEWNPGGIWRPVRLEHTGPVRARSLRVLCREASEEQAVVAFRAELDSDAQRRVLLRTAVGDVDDQTERPLASGPNVVEWTVTVPRPARWWPHALGDQPLHDVVVGVEVDGRVSHELRRRIGLRSLAWHRWTLSVNGERLFLKGSNHGPTRMALAEATPEELRADVALAKDAGLDLLRLHAHITRPELYDAADEAGLLLWQDMPLQWGYARGIRKEAARQATAAVDHLGHHPSIVLWCGHNEPLALDVEPGHAYDRGELARIAARFAWQQQAPTWNKTVLDRSVKRALERADGTRPVIPHSGVLPHPGSGGTDTHVYFGWYHGHERDFPGFCRAVPRLARFVSEFGAQALPDDLGFMEPERWPDLDWARLERRHALQKAMFERNDLGPDRFADIAEWKEWTQEYQATVVKHHIETLRRLKYRPTGGFCQFAFADGHPAVTWAVLDHRRTPKLGFDALREACRPAVVIADRPPAVVAPGDAVALDVHVVSDLRHPLHEALVTASVAPLAGGAEPLYTWRWQGEVPADGCVRVGTIQLIVPDLDGWLSLDLELAAGSVSHRNWYELAIRRPGGPDERMAP